MRYRKETLHGKKQERQRRTGTGEKRPYIARNLYLYALWVNERSNDYIRIQAKYPKK